MNILSNFTDFYDFCFLNEKNESYAKHVFMRKEEYISKSNITLSIEQCDIFKDILTKTVLNKNWDNGLGNDNNNYYLEEKNKHYFNYFYRNNLIHPFFIKINENYYFGYNKMDESNIEEEFDFQFNKKFDCYLSQSEQLLLNTNKELFYTQTIFPNPVFQDLDGKLDLNFNNDVSPLIIFSLDNLGINNIINSIQLKYKGNNGSYKIGNVINNFSFTNSGNIHFFKSESKPFLEQFLNHPEKLYVNIESYLTKDYDKMNMVDISNNDKIEKAGFDLKSSFRKS